MHSNIIYNNESMQLSEEFIDIGYMAEEIEVQTMQKEDLTIKRSYKENEFTLLLSFPNTQKDFLKELLKIDAFLDQVKVNIKAFVIFDKEYEELDSLPKFLNCLEIVIDTQKEYANMYGTQIVQGTFKEMLTKSLFIISKDGALFYIDMPQDLSQKFNLENLYTQMNKACKLYTGVGCHG